MKSLVNFVLKNKLAVWILSLLLIVLGMYSATQMNKESLPNIDVPYLIVTTVYPAATPETVDKEVSEVLETRLKELDNLKNINSTSNQNFSLLTLEFEYGSDIEKLKANVQKELQEIEFKEGIQEPSILALDMNSMPVSSYSISSDKLSSEEVTELIEKELYPKLTDLDGVNNVQVSGLIEERIEIEFKSEMLQAYNLKEEQLIQLIQANNIDMSVGLIEFSENKEAVSVLGSKDTLTQLEELTLPFPSKSGGLSTLKDFVELKVVNLNDSISRVNGSDSFSISVMKGQSANTVKVVDLVNEEIEKFTDKYSNVKVEIVFDQSTEINNSVMTMLTKALFGTLCAIIIIMIFLRDTRSTIISVVSIPLSLLMSAFILHRIGISMNIMSLGAMTVAIGRVIDDSIVVVENIFRRLNDKNEKLKGRALIREATLQMFVPILSSTMVTIAVFLPLMIVGGMVGELFMPFALTMMFSLLSSLVVAITIVPVMAHSFFKKEIYGLKEPKAHHSKPSKLSDFYSKTLTWTLNNKGKTIFVSLLLVVGSLALIPKLGFGFIQEEESAVVSYSYTVENSETEEDILNALEVAENYFIDRKDVTIVQATYGSNDPMMAIMSSGKGGSLNITYESISKKNKALDEVEKDLSKLGLKGVWAEENMASMFNNSEVSYTLLGDNLEDLRVASNEVVAVLEKNKDLKEVKTSLDSVYKENQFIVDDVKLAANGITTAQVGMVLYSMSNETEITTVKTKKGKEMKVVTKTKVAEAPKEVEDLLNRVVGVSPVTNIPVLVKDVVKVEEGTTISSMSKENGKLVATVSGEVKDKDKLSKVNSTIFKELTELKFPAGTELSVGGTTAQMNEAFGQLFLAMIAAIAIVYFILVLTFKEGLAPFAILFSLPMTVIGVILALLVTGLPLDISGMLGLLMLIGIVVTNAIVLIDRVLENEYAGKDIREALVEAGKTRLRPILMTAIATITALIPLAIGAESGGLISQGLGITVIGGLISSTILTLYIVPVIYEGLSKLFKKDRKNINWD